MDFDIQTINLHGIGFTTEAVDPHDAPCTYILSPDGNSAGGLPCVLELGHEGNHIVQVAAAGIIEKGE